MPHEEHETPPRREWRDPATAVAGLLAVAGVALICVDGLDSVWFGREVTFGQWPYLLLGVVVMWFFGVRLFRIGGE
jgi:hypothetical protein